MEHSIPLRVPSSSSSPQSSGSSEPLDAPSRKPRLRGVLHHWAAMAALAAGAVLTFMAPTGRAMVGAAIFATSLFTLYGVSAAYHRPTWGPRARAWMRRLDHASIFILIAGTYTPVSLLALPAETGPKVLALAWGGAAVGVLQSLFWIRAPKFVVAVAAVAVGWSVVPHFGALRAGLSLGAFSLLLAGGILYTLGALAYATKRPNPRPGVFGYHEVFHALTIVAGALHFACVLMLVKGA